MLLLEHGSMRQSLIALWKSGIEMHGYEASSSHRGRLKRPCTYLNGPPMHIKLHMEASTGISLKTRLIISMPKKYMTFRMVFEE